MTAKRQKNRVFPNNKDIKFWYFLIRISHPDCGHIGYYMCKQAYVGSMSGKKQDRLYSQVARQCEVDTVRSGVLNTIVASGSLDYCLRQAKLGGCTLKV